MLMKLFAAWALMAACVIVHAGGITQAVRWAQQRAPFLRRFRDWAWAFVHMAAWVVLLHLVEIGLWAILYRLAGAIADIQTALYFSAVTYTTTGYGDVVLPADWRLVGAVEALTGILMCGWSTGFFFAVVSRMFRDEPATPVPSSRPPTPSVAPGRPSGTSGSASPAPR